MTDNNGLADALAKLQTQLPHIAKSERANTGTYSYTYADLSSITAKVLPLMGKLGLSFTCRPTYVGDRFVLAYRLWHSSGDMLEGEYPLPANGNAQAIGSAISYGRRYVLCSITGVAPDDDDDGAAATAHQATQTQPHAPTEQQHKREYAQEQRKRSAYSAQGNRPAGDDLTIANDKKRLAALHIRLKHYGIGDNRDAALAYMADVIGHEITTSKELTVAQFRDVMDALQADLEKGTDVIPPEADPTFDEEDPT